MLSRLFILALFVTPAYAQIVPFNKLRVNATATSKSPPTIASSQSQSLIAWTESGSLLGARYEMARGRIDAAPLTIATNVDGVRVASDGNHFAVAYRSRGVLYTRVSASSRDFNQESSFTASPLVMEAFRCRFYSRLRPCRTSRY